MAQLLFLMRYPLHKDDNLKPKFDGQMAAARALGHQAAWLGWDNTGIWLCDESERSLVVKCPLTSVPGYEKTLLYIDLMRAVSTVAKTHRFDAVYMRFMPVFYNAPTALAALKAQGAKLIVEHPTYPFENGCTTSLLRKPVFAYNAHVFKKVEPMIDLYTLIGDPCDGTLNGRPAMNILNGVDVERLTLHAPRTGASDVGMLALASMSDWQGYDRLIRALAAYENRALVTLHMAGGEGDGSLAAWKRLAEELGITKQVLFHGELHGAALDDVASQCDIGIGGLGLYRKGQFCSMTLKLREYMGRGLPFCYAVDDPSIPDEPRYCMRLPNDDSPIAMDELVQFALRTRADAQVSAEMRAYALEHMSWTGILKDVFDKAGVEACPKR